MELSRDVIRSLANFRAGGNARRCRRVHGVGHTPPKSQVLVKERLRLARIALNELLSLIDSTNIGRDSLRFGIDDALRCIEDAVNVATQAGDITPHRADENIANAP